MENSKIIGALVEKAQSAQKIAAGYTQEQIDVICLSVAWEVYEDSNIKMLAESAVQETGMGNTADKITKHKNKVMGVIADVTGKKSVGLIEADVEKQIFKYAKPVGVIGALTPVTNPTATPSSNAISILKGGNAVIFAPHPKAKKSSAMAVEMMRKGLARVNAPLDLIQVIEEPSIELTGELMKQADLVLATGGGPMVKAAYSSGTPAYGVGPGNSVQIIAEDADIIDAINKLTISKCFDYATSCSSENSIIVQSTRLDEVITELKKHKAYICTKEEKEQLRAWMWQTNKHGKTALNPAIVARSAQVIANGAGITVPGDTTMLAVFGEMPLEEDLFAKEKISPVLTIWKYDKFTKGYEIMERLTDNCGTGHSCGIHTFNEDYIDYIGRNMRTSRVMVRQAQAAANGGAFFNGMPSTTTLGCGTWGGNITSENITYKHCINVTWLSKPISDWRPTDEMIWGEFFKRYSK